MKELVLQGWHFARVLRMVLALAIVAQGIAQHDFSVILIGFLLAASALFNIGCCGPGGCNVRPKNGNVEKPIDFEEV